MPNITTNMQFNTFLESEIVDIDKINENFEKLDKFVLAIEGGEKTAAFSGGATGNVVWKYKKFSDGSIELYTKLDLSNLKCSNGSKAPYYSNDMKVMFPFQMLDIDNVQLQMRSTNTLGWADDVTGKDILDYVLFRVTGMNSENTAAFKQVYINVKGRWK